MGIWRSLLRRLGYVRLKDYNLRATANGMLVPISSDRPVLIDISHPALTAAPMLPMASLPEPPHSLAEGTVDGLDPAPPRKWIEARTEQLYSEPMAPPRAFELEDSEEDELPYRPWTEEELEP